jgi:predicted Mrr-cat superfamily restriction endonuclease
LSCPREPTAQTSVTFEQAEEQAWNEIEAHVEDAPFDFQDLVADLLRALGYHVSWVAPPGKDGGIDIIAHTDPLGSQTPRIKVQVKRVEQKIDLQSLNAFFWRPSNQTMLACTSRPGALQKMPKMQLASRQREKSPSST